MKLKPVLGSLYTFQPGTDPAYARARGPHDRQVTTSFTISCRPVNMRHWWKYLVITGRKLTATML